jgi:ribosomal silencing factor RsfS
LLLRKGYLGTKLSLQIETFFLDKDRTFDAVFELANEIEEKEAEDVTDLQREEVERLTQSFVVRTKETYAKLMENELVLVTQTEQVNRELSF